MTTENVSKPDTQNLTKIDRAKKNGLELAPMPPREHEPSRMIPLINLRESKNNPRKTFDEKKLAELGASIRVDGMLEDLLVRPTSDTHFEIVFGARRFRAAKLVGLAMVPCKVRQLTDERALELAIVENSQREDVDPLEEAEGFEMLHKKLKQSVEEIAAKIGKSPGHVYNRLKLCELSPEGRDAYRKGTLTAYTAMVVARIPHRELQKQAIAKAVDWNKHPVSAREFAEIVRREFMLSLDRAPFDKKSLTLYPVAGACATCPKRTGNQAELFADAPSKDLCTDPKCFDVKLRAHNDIELKALAAKGVTVLDAKATKKIFGTGHGNYVHETTGFIDLDSDHYDGRTSKKVRTLVKGLDIQRFATFSPAGRLVELVKAGAAKSVLKKEPGRATASSYAQKAKEGAARAAVRNDVQQVALERLGEAAAKKSPNEKALWLFFARALTENAGHDTLTRMAKRQGSKKPQDDARHLKSGLEKKSAGELRGVCVELAASVGAWYGESYGPYVKAACDLFGVKLDKIASEVKAKKAAKKKKPASKSQKWKPSKKGGRK